MLELQIELQRLSDFERMMEELRLQVDQAAEGLGLEDLDEDYATLQMENTKLKHRLAVLKNAVEMEKGGNGSQQDNVGSDGVKNITFDEMIPITEHLVDVFTHAIGKTFPQFVGTMAIIVPVAANVAKFGDYQCNNPMSIVKKLNAEGVSKSPCDIANEIISNVQYSPLVAKLEVGGAGFINVFLDKSYAIKALTNLLRNGVKPPPCKRMRIAIDFSSPNIAKEMHVGHLRSTIIGETISRLLEFVGHDVLRINHLGDWGTQFGMLIAHLSDRFPNFVNESPPISDLQTFYKESKKRFDEDENFKKRAYNYVVLLQCAEKNSFKAWTLICDVSRQEFQKIYNRLDVKLKDYGESFYQSRMMDIVDWLETEDFLEMDEGRKIMWATNEKTGIPLTIEKSDGGYTYDTSDMAAIRFRLEEQKAQWLIYVVDSGQSTHLTNIFMAAERCGILDKTKHRVDHVQFGVVLGENGKKFKTRSGDTVKLTELLDEGLRRAMEKLNGKGRDKVLTPEELKAAQESVAYGCIKYADLCHNRSSEYVFSFDKMLEDRGNTAVYLLYAFTRICSIARHCGEDFSNLEEVLKRTTLELEHEKEWKLAKTLLKFPDVILKVVKNLYPHFLCDYCYELCTVFSEFYDNCYCIQKSKDGDVKINCSRILLCEACAIVLRQCFHLLGIKPIEKI